MQHVAFANDIFLAFEPHLAGILGAGFAAAGDEIGVSDGLGADETLLEIGVDHTRGLRGGPAFVNGPGACFLGADGEIGHQAEQIVAGMDQLDQARLVEAGGGEIFGLLFIVERGEFGFHQRADHHTGGIFSFGVRLDTARLFVAGCGVGFIDIAHVKHRQRR